MMIVAAVGHMMQISRCVRRIAWLMLPVIDTTATTGHTAVTTIRTAASGGYHR